MKFKRLILSTVVFFIPLLTFFVILNAVIYADASDEPYSIVILAGQSWAEGSNSHRTNLEDGTGFFKKNYEGDGDTKLWFSMADGKGPDVGNELIKSLLGPFFDNPNASQSGWVQSGGELASGSNRLSNLSYSGDDQRVNLMGPELGMARELHDKGRKKVIILKVSYGFQALAKSSNITQPFDWNSEPGRNKSYQKLKTDFNNLTAYLNSIGQKYTVDGFMWYQGGTDALDQEYADLYEQNLRDFITRAKTDFQMHPAAHFVAVKFSLRDCVEYSYPLTVYNYCGFPYLADLSSFLAADVNIGHRDMWNRMREVRDSIQKVADDDNNGTMFVDAVEDADLDRSGDHIHLNETANILMGQRMVDMFKFPYRLEGSSDYDGDGFSNPQEDTGRGAACPLVVDGNVVNTANNGNLGDDDADCDGFPNYIDRIFGPGSGLLQ